MTESKIPALAWRQMRALVRRLGSDGGSITPSVYETAQVLRLAPAGIDAERVTGWLVRQQRLDGAWGAGPAAYCVAPTLASVLALRGRVQTGDVRRAVAAGQAFLEENRAVPDAESKTPLPVAVELIVPRLLDELAEEGIHVPREPYGALAAMGERRRQLIARLQPGPQTPPVFTWEAWGEEPAAELVDPLGGVGHSPAATAWWLRLAAGRPELAAGRRMAEEYLRRSSLATGATAGGCQALGVTASPWPMARFEQAFVLYTLATSGLLGARALAGVLAPQLADLRLAIQHEGIGFSDRFAPDGDDTAAGLAVLRIARIDTDREIFAAFARPDHCVAYPFEMHGSHTVTARGAQAMRLLGRDEPVWRESLLRDQDADGWWHGDKWNLARTYGTWVVLLALPGPEHGEAKVRARAAFVAQQHGDGGWGAEGRSSAIETAFGVLALCTLAADGLLDEAGEAALQRAHGYLWHCWRGRSGPGALVWISKELNSPQRIDQAVMLAALLAPERLRKGERARVSVGVAK